MGSGIEVRQTIQWGDKDNKQHQRDCMTWVNKDFVLEVFPHPLFEGKSIMRVMNGVREIPETYESLLEKLNDDRTPST